MKDLMSILEEELDTISDDSNIPAKDIQAMRRALKKLEEGNHDLTELEKSAVKYALEDIGELYLYAGTTSGYRTEDVDSVPKAQELAQNARKQAYRLGVRL